MGSADVIEIDAASHNGVDDARDLRERAGFAPTRDRYKIYILDEAHMVTSQGFNALLKIVEEPPEHVKFIFATTEPEKVIGTIRSRTHHYPFRLVPSAVMLEYVTEVCAQEKVTVEDGVLSLVIRAGGGSVRDTLSLLDQIIAGSDDGHVTRERTNNLLGYTPNELLDECIDAIGRADAALAFAVVDRIIQTGNDPRRFVEDVLERFRDLVIVEATGDGAHAVLRGVPADEIERMTALASLYGARDLSRAADVVNEALSNMTGTTPPRIHLELMIARLLVDGGETVAPAERQTQVVPPAAAPAAAPVKTPAVPKASVPEKTPKETPVETSTTPAPELAATSAEAGSLDELMDIWHDVLEELKANPAVWVVVNAATPTELNGDILTIEFTEQMFLDRFKEKPASGKAVFEELREVIVGALGVRFRFVPRVGFGASSGPVTAQTPKVATPETNPFMQAAAAAVAERENEPTPQPHVDEQPTTPVVTVKPEDEKRGESVIRDLLGATLVATIDGDAASETAETSDDGRASSLFDHESTPDA
jgi:DNA polymerase-3 subunit gamma/tau